MKAGAWTLTSSLVMPVFSEAATFISKADKCSLEPMMDLIFEPHIAHPFLETRSMVLS